MADASTTWTHGLEYAELSDIGMRRTNNQDSCAVVMAGDVRTWQARGHVFIVADGMGAHAAGELASKLAVDNIPHTYRKLRDLPPPVAIEKAIVDGNALIHGRGQASVDFQGMGTTCSTLILMPQGAMLAHVGDSRIYRLRRGQLEQLTFDHSLVWEMMASQKGMSEEAAQLVPKNVITRSLGPNQKVKVDLEGPFPLEVGDKFLLCSDGLTGPVKDEELGVILDCLPPTDAAQTLVDLANLRGGPDNITVIIVTVVAPQVARVESQQGRQADGQPVHPALWVAMGVCLLGSLGMAAMGKMVPAALSLVGSLAAGGVALLQKFGQESSDGAQRIAGPLGKGPHRNYDCRAQQPIVQQLADTVDKLREVARREDWHLDWQQFDTFRDDAMTATRGRDWVRAVREYTNAIRFVMSELRARRSK